MSNIIWHTICSNEIIGDTWWHGNLYKSFSIIRGIRAPAEPEDSKSDWVCRGRDIKKLNTWSLDYKKQNQHLFKKKRK